MPQQPTVKPDPTPTNSAPSNVKVETVAVPLNSAPSTPFEVGMPVAKVKSEKKPKVKSEKTPRDVKVKGEKRSGRPNGSEVPTVRYSASSTHSDTLIYISHSQSVHVGPVPIPR